MYINIKNTLCAALTGLAFIAHAQLIPQDPAVRTGKLSNGFTYYIRRNTEPQKRVLMYLVNKVGSVLEDEDQRGLAHFMEHMNFNGTRNYPKNELVDYLQKAGVRFGADLNAYTSFDETVYELPIPTDDPKMISNGLKIMRDWAQDALLDSIEIEKERGVILEEERLGKGASDRMARKYYPIMLNHARYADRLPIGLDKVLINFKPAVIRRFHHDWYRPDLQALIVVGDVDVNQVEQIVKTSFSNLKNPTNERPRTYYTVALTGNNQFLTVTDKEAPSNTIEVLIKHKAPVVHTEADYLSLMKRSLFNRMLASRRYAEISKQATPAYVDMSASISGLLGGLDMFAFEVSIKNNQTQLAFKQAWEYIEKIKRYGFTQPEFDRAKQSYLRGMDASLKEIDKTNSSAFVSEYQNLFLHNEAAPGIAWEQAFVAKHINQITLNDITSLTDEYLTDINRDILIEAPEKEKANLPDSAMVTGWITSISQDDLAPFKEDTTVRILMVNKPSPGKVVSKNVIPQLNITTLTLSNGVQVVLKPTDFKNDEIKYTAFSPGGTSLYSDADYDAASNAAGLMSRFGVGNLNPVQLTKTLNGKLVNSTANIGARSQIINGVAAPADLETALQLTYLQFTHPRKDSTLFTNIISGAKENLANRYANPATVFNDTISTVLGNYAYRSLPTSIERLNKITLQRAYDIYKERFADASGFTFVFVGNFTIDSITPLLEQYLGSLPSLHKNERARELGIHIPPGQLVKKVYKGTENKALLRLVYSGDYAFNPANNILLKALGDILQIKLLQHIREDEGEVYSPNVQTSYNKLPKNRYAIVVTFGCDPKNVDHLIEMVKKEMEAIRTNGPEADDVQKFKASYVKNVELALKDNGFWLSYLAGQYENGEDVLEALNTDKNLTQVTQANLKDAASNFLSGKNAISFELLPETSIKP